MTATLFVLAVLLIALAPTAPAAEIVMDFNNAESGSFLTTPYTEDGLTMTPLGGVYVISICSLSGFQCASLGDDPTPPGSSGHVRFTFEGGTPFDLFSIWFVNEGRSGTATSSTGATMRVAGDQIVNFVGNDWRGITYFDLQNDPGLFLDFDDVRVAPIPEPSTLSLMLLCGLCTCLSFRRSQHCIIERNVEAVDKHERARLW
jgi:hypothetical protein